MSAEMDDTSTNVKPVYPQKNSLEITDVHRHWNTKVLNLFLGLLVVSGQVGQNVVLPLWIDSGKKKSSSRNQTMANHSNIEEFQPFMDQYFVALFTGFSYMVVFGVVFTVRSVRSFFQQSVKTGGRKQISHKKIVVNGALFGVSCILIVYAASGTRTAPYLQAILMNITLPTTLIIRFIILRKVPTRRKFICAMATIFSLLVCLLPSIFPQIDSNKDKKKEQGGASGLAGVLWPLCFMLGYVFLSLSCIVQETVVQYQHSLSKEKVDLSYIVFLTEISQFILILSLFWVNVIPGFGEVDSIGKIFENCLFGIRCLFGGEGCSGDTGLFAFLYIFLYICYIAGSINLLRYCEGATLLAIVQAMVTPLGFLFWTLFKEQPSFHWNPQVSITVWLNIAGLVIMVPSIYFYNTGEPEKSLKESKVSSERTTLLKESAKQ